ncbi:hypothetical protein E308F_29680 [Moorella sp. E308F]|uniref:class II glutamine amidotransferase n=1 Tax=Moorella sp. E308F TaxID=2572682 RepID=UPI0010FFAD9D|nr:class II glutamine amidotransferase [Moorella sp. E308F]GEA16722.1 hypothetical protein E308F_29680 [Moorella sp. E308F]
MCGLFGFSYYGMDKMNFESLLEILGLNSTERGMDATGIAYVQDKNVVISKNGVSAYRFKFKVPKDAKVVMGHVRHTTQGSAKKNYNNHPFLGRAGGIKFALAHNGVLYNDRELKIEYGLPKTQIETDSYVAVQLLELYNKFDMNSIREMAETVEGMFTFTLLDQDNNLYIVKNDSPFSIMHIPDLKLYVYASTKKILVNSLLEWPKTSERIFNQFKTGIVDMELIEPKQGDIITICPDGTLKFNKFKPQERTWYRINWKPAKSSRQVNLLQQTTSIITNMVTSYEFDNDVYFDMLCTMANQQGVSKEEVLQLLEWGFTLEDIEDALYTGDLKSFVADIEEDLVRL